MIEPRIIIGYLSKACADILARGTIDGRGEYALRPAQRQGCEEFLTFLNREDLTDKQKLTGFWELPQGVGKTAFVGAITDFVRRYAHADGYDLKVGIVSSRVNLLNQIRDEELEVLFPDLKGQVGVYGGNLRELDKPVTVITYESWPKLPKPDLLFSDEGHRGTTDDRALHLATAYPDIARYAVTATAHYDPSKTVYNTHRNLIFEKHIATSIRDGELASYIQTQAYIIRVIPGEDEDVKLARQLAFNQFVDRLLINGRDERTGDLLTDNQGGVFVEDTKQADHLADLLNKNPHYQEIARRNKCDAFAVSIHTVGISDREQERREKAYKQGRYWFVVGDEKLTEGFNFRPMKTVIDTPHGSWVKKAQIVGRGDREYYNKHKRRYEGLTFIDAILYTGCDPSTDPENIITPEEARERDQKALRKAKAYAVTAFKVLDGNVEISGPSAPPPEPLQPDPPVDILPEPPTQIPPINIPPAGGPSKPPVSLPPVKIPPLPPLPPINPFEGLQVISYATLEAVRTLQAEQQKILAQFRKENITEDQVIEWIRATRKKTGKYPSITDVVVWSETQDDEFVAIENETWNSVDHVISNGGRGLVATDGVPLASSLFEFRRKHGLIDPHEHYNDKLTKDLLIKWIKDTREKTGKYPSVVDQIVWNKKANGDFEKIESENWTALNASVGKGNRGLAGLDGAPFAKSLPDFRKKYGLDDNLTVDMVRKWIKDTKAKTGKYPSKHDKEVWSQRPDGTFELIDEKWSSIQNAVTTGTRGLANKDGSPVAASLTAFKDKFKLAVPDLTPDLVREWIEATYEKTGAYPAQQTKSVWRRKTGGGFEVVPDENWRGINSAFKHKTRGLVQKNGAALASSLPDFRKKCGLVAVKFHYVNRALTVDILKQWIEATKEKTGEYPRNCTKAVWIRTPDGKFKKVKGESWQLIGGSIQRKERSLINPDGSRIADSLSDFNNKNGYIDDFKAVKKQVTSNVKPINPAKQKRTIRPREKTPH